MNFVLMPCFYDRPTRKFWFGLWRQGHAMVEDDQELDNAVPYRIVCEEPLCLLAMWLIPFQNHQHWRWFVHKNIKYQMFAPRIWVWSASYRKRETQDGADAVRSVDRYA